MNELERFLTHGAYLGSITREQEIETMINLCSFLTKKKYIQVDVLAETTVNILLYEELVFEIEIKDCVLKIKLYSENFFEPMIDLLGFIGKFDPNFKPNQVVYEEDSEESSEEDEWL